MGFWTYGTESHACNERCWLNGDGDAAKDKGKGKRGKGGKGKPQRRSKGGR